VVVAASEKAGEAGEAAGRLSTINQVMVMTMTRSRPTRIVTMMTTSSWTCCHPVPHPLVKDSESERGA